MKNTNFQERLLCDEVETHLRDSIPNIAKNICESFAKKPKNKFVQLLDRASLFGQQKWHELRSKMFSGLTDSAKGEMIRKMHERSQREPEMYGRELGLKPSYIRTVLDTYERVAPAEPSEVVTGVSKKGKSRKNPVYEYQKEKYDEKMREYMERQKLLTQMAGVRRFNPNLAAAHQSVESELRGGSEVATEMEKRSRISGKKAEQIKQKRIRRGYINP